MAELVLLGQVDNATAPVNGAAELYVLSSGYGAPVGADALLLVETPDVAPAGSGGKVLWRRVLVPFERTAGCTIRVTPIADFGIVLNAHSESFDSPAEIAKSVVVVPVARTCTYLRVRIEVTERTGLVRVFSPTVLVKPVHAASPLVVSTSAV